MRAHASPPPGRGRSVGALWPKVHLSFASISMLRQVILNTPLSVTDESPYLYDNLFYQLLVILTLRHELTVPVPGQRVCTTLSLLY